MAAVPVAVPEAEAGAPVAVAAAAAALLQRVRTHERIREEICARGGSGRVSHGVDEDLVDEVDDTVAADSCQF